MEIKGYKILREINRGPVTTVFVAEQTILERPVLLKVLNIQWKDERDLIERFRREAKISARLRHPNIVNIYDFGISDEYFYISMEYIEGLTLSHFIKQHHPLSPAAVLYIMREILTGLDYAHKRGVVHRDIKPSNILVQEDGMVKIADFGMAIIADLPGLTQQGSAVGSPAYMSPEQALGKKMDATSDIFSLAVTVYEMLTARSPFRGNHVAESINKTLNEQPPSLHTIREDVPVLLSDIIDSMLEKDARNRPADCAILLTHLDNLSGWPDRETFAAYLHNPDKVTLNTVYQRELIPSMKRQPSTLGRILYPVIGLIFLAVLFLLWRHWPVRQVEIRQDTVSGKQIWSATKQSSGIPETADVESHIDRKAQNNHQKTNRPSLTDSMVTAKQMPDNNPVNVRPAELFIICKPWADIYINDKKVDTTPLSKSIFLVPGNYSLQLKNPGFQIYRTDLILNPAQKDTLRVTLQNVIGYLDLRVNPWARVYIDGKYKETTPLSSPISLPEGEHLIELENPAFTSIKDTVWIKAGRTIKKRVRFRK